MTSYTLDIGSVSEPQRSSGLWIATAAGSTAAICAAGGRNPPLRSRKLQYLVREPYNGGRCRYRLRKGIVGPETLLVVTSKTRRGRLFIDGPHLRFSLASVWRSPSRRRPRLCGSWSSMAAGAGGFDTLSRHELRLLLMEARSIRETPPRSSGGACLSVRACRAVRSAAACGRGWSDVLPLPTRVPPRYPVLGYPGWHTLQVPVLSFQKDLDGESLSVTVHDSWLQYDVGAPPWRCPSPYHPRRVCVLARTRWERWPGMWNLRRQQQSQANWPGSPIDQLLPPLPE